MNEKPEKPDIHLTERLTSEKAIRYLIYHAMKAYQRALKAGKIFQSEESHIAVLKYQVANDSVQAFIEEHIERVDGKKTISQTEVFEKYKDFCKEMEYKALSAHKFYQAMEQKKYFTSRDEKGRYFDGIVYVEEKQDEQSTEMREPRPGDEVPSEWC